MEEEPPSERAGGSRTGPEEDLQRVLELSPLGQGVLAFGALLSVRQSLGGVKAI
jgi:hypothetical protein